MSRKLKRLRAGLTRTEIGSRFEKRRDYAFVIAGTFLMAAVSKKQGVILRELVAQIDPEAFMILTDAQEIRGEGFLGYSREEL